MRCALIVSEEISSLQALRFPNVDENASWSNWRVASDVNESSSHLDEMCSWRILHHQQYLDVLCMLSG